MEPAEELLELLSLDCARHGNLLVGHSEVNIQHQRFLTRTGTKLDEELFLIYTRAVRDWNEYPLEMKSVTNCEERKLEISLIVLIGSNRKR